MDILFVFGIGILRILQSSFNKKSSKYLPTTNKYLRFGLYFESSAALFAVVYLFVYGFFGLDQFTILCSVLMGTAFLMELTTALKALQNAPISLCTMCSLGGGIIIPAICGIFFFDEPISILGWLGILLFFLSAYFLIPHEKKSLKIKKSTILILIVNFVINGFCGIISKFFAVRSENGNAALFACLSYTFAAILFAAVIIVKSAIAKQNASTKDTSTDTDTQFLPKPVYLTGGLVGAVCASIVFFTTVLSRTVSIVVLNTIPNAVCLIGCLAIDVLIYKDKLTLRKIFGVVLNVISTAVIVIL